MKSYLLNRNIILWNICQRKNNWNVHDLDAQDVKDLKRHIYNQEYFASLATVISLVQQQRLNMKKQSDAELFNETIDQIVDELKYLQKYYLIYKKPQKHSAIKK